MNALIAISILSATAIVGELRYRHQQSNIDGQQELQDH